METFSALLALCEGNPPLDSPHIGHWHGAMMFSLMLAKTNSYKTTGVAGDLRRSDAHCDVNVIILGISLWNPRFTFRNDSKTAAHTQPRQFHPFQRHRSFPMKIKKTRDYIFSRSSRRGMWPTMGGLIVLAAAKTFNSDFCHKVTNALY